MKIKKLIITNVGKLAGEQEISVNKPLILFYGEKPSKIPSEVGVFVVEDGKLHS